LLFILPYTESGKIVKPDIIHGDISDDTYLNFFHRYTRVFLINTINECELINCNHRIEQKLM